MVILMLILNISNYHNNCRFSTPKQKFVLCSEQIEPGPRGCGHVSWQELVLWPGVYYLVWLILYVLIVNKLVIITND